MVTKNAHGEKVIKMHNFAPYFIGRQIVKFLHCATDTSLGVLSL